MINTYQTSLAPPPVPPRLSRSQTVLIPGPLPSQGHTKVLIRFLVGVVVLHLLLSVGGFIFLYHNDQMEAEERSRMKDAEGRKLKEDGGRANFLSSDNQEMSSKALARMVVRKESVTAAKVSGYLKWDINQSSLKKINHYEDGTWLTILQPGVYYVYSRVTFTKHDPLFPLESTVRLKKHATDKGKDVMEAYCSLDSSTVSSGIPFKCTASQGQLITLENGNQLSVWVRNLSMVSYDLRATTFGIYKL